MKDDLDSFFAEFQKTQNPWSAIYQNCLSIQEKYKPQLERNDYTLNANKIITHYKNGLSTSAAAWCVITLCQLKKEILDTSDITIKSANNQNPLERDLLIALNLPGEHLGERDIIWQSLRNDFSFNTSGNLDQKFLQALQSCPNETHDNSNPLNKIKRQSSLYYELFSLFTHLIQSKHSPDRDMQP
ncbi:hypothetical protein [Pseudomonas akapageensis]|uniref:hypothetical protein n=1 Tax=Pseudomonas akapageensis TaxID=2609961 RepID=UPI00140D4283|nr:hypothetical protein [Pseudomonas akapageensis]